MNEFRRITFGALLAVILLTGSTATALPVHPISVSRTFVYVRPDSISVSIELLLEDLYLFHQLKPDDSNFLSVAELNRGVVLHKEFVAERFVMRDADGNVLRPKDDVNVTVALPDAGVALPELMSHKITFDLQYDLAKSPEFLTFEQLFSGPDAVLPAEMQLLVRQQGGTELLNQSIVSRQSQTVRFDWTAPQPAADASEAERRQWQDQQTESTLGISSYSSVYSFLYIEEFELRHEILIPLSTLQEAIELSRKDRAFLTVEEQDAVRQRIEEYFVTGNPLQIDGNEVLPIVDRCDFYGVSFKDFAQPAERRPVAMSSGRLGIILSWPLKQPANSLRLTWDRFSKSVWAVKMAVIEGELVRRVTLAKVGNRNIFDWAATSPVEPMRLEPVTRPQPKQSVVSLPVVSVCMCAVCCIALLLRRISVRVRAAIFSVSLVAALVGPMLLPAAMSIPIGRHKLMHGDAEAISRRLLSQVYAAFRYRTEDDVYDALSVSVNGTLLQDIYLQLLQGLRMQEQGGAVARIENLQIVSGRELPDENSSSPEFGYKCTWIVAGQVEHWGHIHHRENQFTGRLTVRWSGENWKLIRLAVSDEHQLSFSTRVRNFTSDGENSSSSGNKRPN